jgi:hypothetical protein
MSSSEAPLSLSLSLSEYVTLPAKLFLTSKFNYLLFFAALNPTHKTKTETQNKCVTTTNSNTTETDEQQSYHNYYTLL